MENRQSASAAGGGELEANSSPVVKDESAKEKIEDSELMKKTEVVANPDEDQYPEEGRGHSEDKSYPFAHKTDGSAEESDEPMDTSLSTDIENTHPQLTLVVIGDTSSVDIGPENILLDHDEQCQFSSRLYDLYGQEIAVINLLGQQNVDQIPSNQGIHAFLLLLPNGLHSTLYKSGLMWLEHTFGRQSLAYLMTVLTHHEDENCEGTLRDLEAKNCLVKERSHMCRRSLTEAAEIVELLDKINTIVSENSPCCYRRQMFENIEQNKQLEYGEQMMKSSVFQEKQAAAETENNTALKEREPSEVEKSKDNLATQREEPQTRPPVFSAGRKSGDEIQDGETKAKSGPVIEHGIPSEKTEGSHTGLETGNSEDDSSDDKKKQSEEISEEILPQQHQKETETLFTRLHLQDKHPQKLIPEDFLQISPCLNQNHDIYEKDLAFTFLQGLMMLDYRARFIPVRQDSVEETPLEPAAAFDTTETDENDLEALLCTSIDENQTKQTQVHPIDVQMAVFHCSNSFLRQIMITKLSQCQYALPLLVPDPFTMEIECPMWAFRLITKTWKVTEDKDTNKCPCYVTMKNIPIYKAETPLVSFFRLGSLSVSKSELMNSLINDRHSTFFHRNSAGSTKSRHLLDGVAEIAWYCPAGKPNDAFNGCVAFCNLHGDAVVIDKQREILIEKSSINVVLVPNLQKGDKSWPLISALFTTKKPLICLIVNETCGPTEIKKGKYKMGLKDKSLSDVSSELKQIIQDILSLQDPTLKMSFQLETMAEIPGIKVDESGSFCQRGKSSAIKIASMLQNKGVSKIKSEFLPCQGNLWHKWCKLNKELYHLKGQVEMEKSNKQNKLMEIRQKQCDAYCHELMHLFTKSLSSLSSEDRNYFLKWTQILTDALSTDDISSILQSYDDTWSEILTLKNKKKPDKPERLEEKKNELECLSEKLQSATFGLEHLFREMIQIYEAHETTGSRRGEWSQYPKLAADLLISGHPLELMDGDAGHVPLKWISSLLQEVINKLGDQKVFVLSVLGVQSSGKSTMLNAMFGLQFAVSAGRCTRGAFMQLVKLSDRIKENYEFDYILVVDTEGLRALELAGTNTLHHDNELATFVVGVGNMTLINIFGENPAEMQDVLQIVVQAFMRMKKVKLSPSCVFVHQNVTDIAAAERNMDGKRRLQEKLDQMAQLAAKEEDSNAESFSDIISFDVQRDVKYLAQLWEGSPPMAPPNPGYSESIQELKSQILSKASRFDGIKFSQLNSKVQDLWNALLNENFVFSFKNTLEIAVYRKLEVQYGNWTWAIRDNMLTIENQLHNRIENGQLNKVESNCLNKEARKTYEDVTNSMRAYFEDNKDKETLVQWKGRFESKIKEFHDEQVKVVKRKLDEVIQQKNARKKLEDKKTVFENKLLQMSKELAQLLKVKAKDEEELQKEFSSVWKTWVTELTSDTEPVKNINLEEDLSDILEELGIEPALTEECKSSGRYKLLSLMGDYVDYITLPKNQDLCETSKPCERDEKQDKDTRKGVTSIVKSFFGFLTGKSSPAQTKPSSHSLLFYEEQNQIRELISKVVSDSLVAIKKQPVATRGYGSTYLREMSKLVKESVMKFQSVFKYRLKKEFEVDLLLYVFDNVKGWILDSQATFIMNTDALTYLESKKMYYYNIFKSYCKGSSSAVVLSELLCENLKTSITEAVYNKTAIGLTGEMRCNFSAFNGNRLNLEKHVLRSLAEKEYFNDFIKYLRNPRSQTEAFIKAEVQKYLSAKHKDKAQNTLRIFHTHIEDINRCVGKALSTATQKVQTNHGDIKMWLRELASLLKDELKINNISSENFSDIIEFKFLLDETNDKLKTIIMQIRTFSVDELKKSRQKPEDILIDQLCRCCWVKCPFCSAVCTNTIENHSPDDHSVPFHRPSGINGWHYRNTVEMSINFCTTDVASDGGFYPHHESETSVPYKQYRTAGPEYAAWKITPDESKLAYWKWFMCRFQKELEKHYSLKFEGLGEIPADWRIISKIEAIKSLEEMCK